MFLSPFCSADGDLHGEESRQHARQAGPERPSWLPRSSPEAADLVDRQKKKTEKKHKKGKKHKKDKQHKEKRRRTKEPEAASQ